jgi:hypothetical protein
VLGIPAQRVEVRPRRFRIHMIDRHRRDAAPVVDTGGNQLGIIFGDVAVPGCSSVARTDARRGNGPQQIVAGLAARCICAGLARF